MVRFERKETAKSLLAVQSLAHQKTLKSGSYGTDEVRSALHEMFHHKCYLCENKNLVGGYQIEHLIPHKGDIDLKFDWNNLFLACIHCNNTKLDRFYPILDCSKVDVDRKISFRQKSVFRSDEVEICPLESEQKTLNTAALLESIYTGTTLDKRIEAQNLRNSLKKELNKFEDLLNDYYNEDVAEDKAEYFLLLRLHLKPTSPFTAFKRWIVRDQKERYPELLPYI